MTSYNCEVFLSALFWFFLSQVEYLIEVRLSAYYHHGLSIHRHGRKDKDMQNGISDPWTLDRMNRGSGLTNAIYGRSHTPNPVGCQNEHGMNISITSLARTLCVHYRSPLFHLFLFPNLNRNSSSLSLSDAARVRIVLCFFAVPVAAKLAGLFPLLLFMVC